MNNSNQLTAAIIAGGKSRRFGSPKALALLGDATLIERALSTARAISETVLLNYGAINLFEDQAVPAVQDIIPDCGPLGGIYTVLRHAATPWVAALPCDLPFLVAEVYGLLFKARRDTRPVAAVSERGTEPLVSIWPKAICEDVEALIQKGIVAMHQALKELQAVEVNIPQQLPDYRREIFFNINRVEDLEQIRNS